MYERTALHGLTPHFDWTESSSRSGHANVHAMNVAEPKFYKAFDALLAAAPLATSRPICAGTRPTTPAPYLSKSFEMSVSLL